MGVVSRSNFPSWASVSINRLMLWYMFAGTRGGYTRGFILKHLTDKSYNVNELAEILNTDHRTISHHLDVLVKDGIITIEGNKYDKMYFLSKTVNVNLNEFNMIWEKISL
jgi:DNA-binding transcriptional ArsR family regulator